jgi:hypothetical protein
VEKNFGFNSRVLPEPLTDIGSWVEFCTFQAHSRLSNINFDIWIFLLEETLYISDEKFPTDNKVLSQVVLRSKGSPGWWPYTYPMKKCPLHVRVTYI